MRNINRKTVAASIIAVIGLFIGYHFGREYGIILYLAGCGLGGFYLYHAEKDGGKKFSSPFDRWLGNSFYIFAITVVLLVAFTMFYLLFENFFT